jgi:hypothetical protein
MTGKGATVSRVTVARTDPAELLRRLLRGRAEADGPLLHVERVPARPGETPHWPGWVPPSLDTYLVHHPQALFGRGVEATVLDPAKPLRAGATPVLRRR